MYYKWADVKKDGSPSPLARLASLHVTLPKWQIIGIHLLTGDSSHYLNLFARRVVSLPDKLVESTAPSPPLSFVHERQNYQSPNFLFDSVLGPGHHLYAKVLAMVLWEFTQQVYDHCHTRPRRVGPFLWLVEAPQKHIGGRFFVECCRVVYVVDEGTT